MNADQLINILVTITLIEMMATMGLGVAVGDLLVVARDGRLLGRALLGNYILVPAVTVGLLLAFDSQPAVAAGFLILALCPGAPYGPPCTALAKGNTPVAVGLMVLLAGSSALVAPLALYWLLPLVAAQGSVSIDASKIVVTLLVTQLLPLSAGLTVRFFRPTWADALQKPGKWISKVLNLVAIGSILVMQFHLLMEIRARGFGGMLILLLATWLIGWLLGGRDAATRRTMTITTSLRNIGVGLVVAAGTFPGTPAVTAVAAYALVSLFGTLGLAVMISRIPAAGSAPLTSSTKRAT